MELNYISVVRVKQVVALGCLLSVNIQCADGVGSRLYHYKTGQIRVSGHTYRCELVGARGCSIGRVRSQKFEPEGPWPAYRDLGDGNQMGLGSAPKLRVSGVYQWSRNPIYVGFHLMTIAAVLYTLNPLVLLLAVTTIAVHHAVVRAEEVHLTHEVGPAYIEYQRRVRRYI